MEKGKELRGKYMVLRQLGEGGEGAAYLAYDNQTDHNVVIKELSQNPTAAKKAAWNKLVQLGKLPGIVQLLDVWEEEQTCYMVIEYAEGHNGVEYLREHPQGISPEQTLAIMNPVIEGLALMHEKGLLHRDVSTDNIIITKDGKGILCDLGMVCEIVGDDVSEGVPKVKNGFSPLEMYLDGKQGTWCDVYEVCASMYHLMTGQVLPVPAMREKGDPFAGLSLQIPDRMSTLIRLGLEVEVENRLKDLAMLRGMSGQGESGSTENAVNMSSGVRQTNEVYVAQPQMRTLPVNTQSIMSLQPDHAMNARRGKAHGTGRKIVTALGIVCLILAVFGAGFMYYRTMNEDDTEDTADEDKKSGKDHDSDAAEDSDSDKAEASDGDAAENSDDGNESVTVDISLEELMEKYAEYMEDYAKELRLYGNFDGYKLVCIDDDELPECVTSCYGQYMNLMIYYNKFTGKCEHIYFMSDLQGELVRYSERGNILCCQDVPSDELINANAYIVEYIYFQFNNSGSLEVIGNAYEHHANGSDRYRIANRDSVKKSEFDEYQSDFGELDKSFTYEDMYVSLDKAYEKYLAE